MQRTIPPYRADHVGSLMRPAALLAAREEHRAGKPPPRRSAARGGSHPRRRPAARRHRASRRDRRRVSSVPVAHRLSDRLRQCGEDALRGDDVHFHSEEGDTERELSAFRVAGRLRRPHPIFVDDFSFLKSVATVTPKTDHPLADHHAFPRRPRCRRRRRLSRYRPLLRRSRARLSRGDRRSRRCRLPLSADRRGEPRLSLRSRRCAPQVRTSARIRTRCRRPMPS